MRRASLAVVLGWPLVSALAGQQQADPFAARLAMVVPRADELAWRAVPWRAELRAAVLEANAADKPVLLWSMNGHPLGQT